MLNFIKKQSVGIYLTAAAVLIGLVAFILYIINGSVSGYFQGTNETAAVVMSVFALISLCGVIALSQFKFHGIIEIVVKCAIGILRVLGVILLISTLMLFISSRAEGLAFIFGSNADVIAEVQTPANMSSAGVAITGFAFYGIAWLVGLVGCFFKAVKQ